MIYHTVTYAVNSAQLLHYQNTNTLQCNIINAINMDQARISMKDRRKAAQDKNAVAIIIVDPHNQQIAFHTLIRPELQ